LDLVNPGLLGSKLDFNRKFATVIQDGLKKDPKPLLAMHARKAIMELKKIYKPHIMRRLKSVELTVKSSETSVI
jgi:SNF2 family DNA or RNA helicase